MIARCFEAEIYWLFVYEYLHIAIDVLKDLRKLLDEPS